MCTRYNIESTVREFEPDFGILRREEISLTRFVASTGDELSSGSGNPNRVVLNSRIICVRWAAAAGASHPITANIDVPNDYYEGVAGSTNLNEKPTFKLRVTARKRQGTGTTDENATLKLNLAVSIDRGGAATTDLAANIATGNLNAITATVATTDTGTGFAEYVFDIGAALTAQSSSLKIQRGDKVYLGLVPSATVGSSTMVLEVKRVELEWRRHLAAASSALR